MIETGSVRRRQLGAFLRARRESLAQSERRRPGERRRTPGLRREEVAQLCGISTTWYTWMEQGRDIAVSATALDRLARALRLTAAERAYLFALAQRRDPVSVTAEGLGGRASADLQALLHAITAPAYLLDRLWTVLGWNEAAGHLFAPWFDSREPCLLRYVFLDPSARDFIEDWDDRARRLVGEFRADTARFRDDAAVVDLVNDLMRRSAVFARVWSDQAVLAREGGARTFNHPQDGLIRYEQATLLPATHPGIKLVVLLPPEH